MKSVQFGATRFRIPRIGLGTAAIGRPGYINLGHDEDFANGRDLESMHKRTHRLLSEAYRFGVRYFDTARSYGEGERFLGQWLEVLNSRDVLMTGSKWGYTYVADWKVDVEKHEVKDHSIELLNKQWDESQVNLGPFLSVYHIHSATLDTGVLGNKDVLNRLYEIKQKGIIIGLSVSGERQGEVIEKARGIEVNGETLFESIQVTWNVFETSTSHQLRLAAEQGMGIIIKESVANGRLTDRNKNESDQEKLSVVKSIATSHDVSLDAVAMAYALAQPWNPIVLSGASTSDQLLSNLRADQVQLSITDFNALNKLSELPSEYWKTRSQLVWN